MSHKRTDFRYLQARRERAIIGQAQLYPPKPTPVDGAEIAAAIAAGKLRRIPEKRKTR